jgi:predicted ATPase
MRIEHVWIDEFKNLRDLEIDFDKSELSTVLIGENGTGKSNVIEALATIFRDLDLGETTSFNYSLSYECKGRRVEVAQRASQVDKGLKEEDRQFRIIVDGEPMTRAAFNRSKDDFLPNHVFGYYSGVSRRLEAVFDRHQERYYREIIRPGTEQQIDPRSPGLRRLFYCRPSYGQFALLSYFAFDNQEARRFLLRTMGISALDSALFVLRRPRWSTKRPNKELRSHGDSRFWYATGIVRHLLTRMWDHSLAPIRTTETVQDDYRTKSSGEQRAYQFIQDEKTLRQMAKGLGDEKAFFTYLESLDISDLVREVRIWVKRQHAERDLPFHEISDGEKQLLIVLGLMKFTGHEESLFLLDEPDTHLNPLWKWNYLKLIEEVAGDNGRSHLIMTSHDPLTIAGLSASQVQVMYKTGGVTSAKRPNVDPRGLGFTTILTHIFGLPTTVDPETKELLDERNRILHTSDKRPEDQARLLEITQRLDSMGFQLESREAEYALFLRAMHDMESTERRTLTPDELQARNELAREIVRRIREGKQQ